MWTIVYMVKNEATAYSVKEKLKADKIMVMLRKVDDFFEVLVPSAELSLAHKIIIDSEM